jgi:hypothetical protein
VAPWEKSEVVQLDRPIREQMSCSLVPFSALVWLDRMIRLVIEWISIRVFCSLFHNLCSKGLSLLFAKKSIAAAQTN